VTKERKAPQARRFTFFGVTTSPANQKTVEESEKVKRWAGFIEP